MLAQLSFHEGQSVTNIPAQAYEMLRFLSDVRATFRGEKHGVVAPWQYSSSLYPGDPVCGAHLWESFLKAPNSYYLLANETRLIKETVGGILQDRRSGTVVVDFGQGPAQTVEAKTLPVIRQLENVVAYCPLDTCKDYLVEAANVISRENPGTAIKACHVDYLRDDVILPRADKILGLFFGGTIGNVPGHPDDGLPASAIISHLRRMKSILGDNATLIMTHDSNQDELSILKSYAHELQIAFGSNLMYRIKRDLPVYGAFDPAAWHYEPIWYAHNYQLCHTIICDRDQSFLLGNKHFSIKRGEQFILNNSFKFPVERVKEWAAQAGFPNQKHVMDHEGRQVLHVLSTTH